MLTNTKSYMYVGYNFKYRRLIIRLSYYVPTSYMMFIRDLAIDKFLVFVHAKSVIT